MADAGSGMATQAFRPHPASPSSGCGHRVVPWNDREAVERALAERPVAAILCEPYPANMGLVPPEPGFLEFLREQASSAGALLVFDEVISGFRVARGGAQEREEVHPDLTVLGKVIAAACRRRRTPIPEELMLQVRPEGHRLTRPGPCRHPLATAAGLATLRLLSTRRRTSASRAPRRLSQGLLEAGCRPPGSGGPRRPAHRVLQPRAGERLRRRPACDLEAYAAFCCRPSWSAACIHPLAVRSVVSLAGPQARAREADRICLREAFAEAA